MMMVIIIVIIIIIIIIIIIMFPKSYKIPVIKTQHKFSNTEA